MFVGAEVVDPELLCPRFLGGRLAVEDLNSLATKNERAEAENLERRSDV
jgi:hypothetical protein